MKYLLVLSVLSISGCFYKEPEKLADLPAVATPCFSCGEEEIIQKNTNIDITEGL